MKKRFGWILLLWLSNTFALSWNDLWYTPDQQGKAALEKKQPVIAAEKFDNPLWKGVALYRAGQYPKAVEYFSKFDTALADYNRGNALAGMGEYQKAIAAYETALKKNPDFFDAKYNLDRLKKLMQQNQTQNQKNQHHNNKPNEKNNDSKANQKENSKDNQKNQQEKPSGNNKQEKPQQQPQNNETQQNLDPSQQKQKEENNVNQKPSSASQSQIKQNENEGPKEMSAQSLPDQQQQMSQQELKKWLQQIPDNPGGLLKQKFLRDHYLKEKETHENF